MILWKNIIPGPDPPQVLYALVECPKGARNKYEMSKKANVLLLDRVLHSSVIYPHDYGFIPGTFADDGDPLDVLILQSTPVDPMTLVKVHPIGVLLMEDDKGLDEKILAISMNDPIYGHSNYEDIVQLPHHTLDEISEFFKTYKNLEDKSYAEVKEWRGREKAYIIIEECIERFKDLYGDIATLDPAKK